MSVRRKLAQWLYITSAVVHAALYPLSLIAIVVGFWRNGFWHGLLAMVLITVATVGLKLVIVGTFAALIRWVDPKFFQLI